MQEIEPERLAGPVAAGPASRPRLPVRLYQPSSVLSFAIRHAQRPTRRPPWLAAADRLRGISSVDAANAFALEPLVEVQLPASALPVPDMEETQRLAGQRVTVIELSDGTVQAPHGGKRVPLTRSARTMRKRAAERRSPPVVHAVLRFGAARMSSDGLAR
jgi:hypothetical protein